MSKIILSKSFINNSVKLALNEDLYPDGDITSNLMQKGGAKSFKIIANQNGIIGGIEFAKSTFKVFDDKIQFHIKKKDGSQVKKSQIIAMIKGDSKNILICERVALNFLSHISGIASYTNKFVKLAKGKSKICCTRKTIPNLRVIQKYAVKLGGGTNHRFNLSDEFLIKDNHIASSDLKFLVQKAIKNKKGKKITVEVDNLKQLKSIVGIKFNTVLFDNMNIKSLRDGVKLAKKYYETEASGNVTLRNIKSISKTGLNYVSCSPYRVPVARLAAAQAELKK